MMTHGEVFNNEVTIPKYDELEVKFEIILDELFTTLLLI